MRTENITENKKSLSVCLEGHRVEDKKDEYTVRKKHNKGEINVELLTALVKQKKNIHDD